MKKLILTILIGFVAISVCAQKFEGLALTPPMGWNSWNHFQCNVNEAMIKEMADAMVTSGMREAGYTYIVIDDCWHGDRDSLGFIQPHPDRFPSGMKSLADYIHSKGLKFGIYSSAGFSTCAGYPASRGYEYQDALTYASWGVDYLKYDWCGSDGTNAVGAYTTMRDALYKAGRKVVFSICEWGDNQPWEWAKEVGHLWRTTGDIHLCWDCQYNHGTWSSWGFLKILDMHEGHRAHNGPGRWNDPDMLQVGNGMSNHADRAHFSMWAMLAAPLMAGNDLRSMSAETIEILTNREVLAVNQDSLGIQAFKYHRQGTIDVWVKPLKGGDVAMAFLNRAEFPMSFEFNWKDHVIKDEVFGQEFNFESQPYAIKNLWSAASMGNTSTPLKVEVAGQDVLMLRLSR